MDFKDQLNQLAERALKLRDSLKTEEATKTSLIMPFIQALGYDIFNPTEVVPEYTCDIGTKKGEKVDYAIILDGNPVILIECKLWSENLNLHDNQLLRYFHVSKAKFGILTNGLEYKFYTDVKESNKMDEKPFLDISVKDLKDYQIDELKKFHKSYFNIESILSSASELKYMNELKAVIQEELKTPSPEFTKLLLKRVYDGPCTQKVLDQFSPLVKRTISTYINELINVRLKGALENEKKEQEELDALEVTNIEDNNGIFTTDEELEGYMIVKAISREIVDIVRVVYRDSKSYFAVFFDDNNRKPICRLYLNTQKKYIGVFNENKEEHKYEMGSISDIYNYAKEIKDVIEYYLK